MLFGHECFNPYLDYFFEFVLPNLSHTFSVSLDDLFVITNYNGFIADHATLKFAGKIRFIILIVQDACGS